MLLFQIFKNIFHSPFSFCGRATPTATRMCPAMATSPPVAAARRLPPHPPLIHTTTRPTTIIHMAMAGNEEWRQC